MNEADREGGSALDALASGDNGRTRRRPCRGDVEEEEKSLQRFGRDVEADVALALSLPPGTA